LCNGAPGIAVDEQIDGCTALINAGALTPQGFSIAYNLRGNAYVRKADYDRAIADFDQSVKFNPNYAKAFNNRGVAFRGKANYERAIEDFTKSISLNPDYVLAYANRADVYQRKGNYKAAIEDYGAVLRLAQQDPKQKPRVEAARNEMCWSRAVVGELQPALADCNEALREEPNAAAILDSRGLVYLKMGQWDAALADYDAALRLNPKLATSLYGRGTAKLKKGDAKGGNADHRAAAAIKRSVAQDFKRYGVN
jgi:tetratricopeptide (TPR) repeat protein